MQKISIRWQYILFALILPLITVSTLFTLSSYHFQNNISILDNRIVAIQGINTLQSIQNNLQIIKSLDKKENLSAEEFKILRNLIKTTKSQIDLFKNHLQIHSKKYSNIIEMNNFLHSIEEILQSATKYQKIKLILLEFPEQMNTISKNANLLIDNQFSTNIVINAIIQKFPKAFELSFQNKANEIDKLFNKENYTILNISINMNYEALEKSYQYNIDQLNYILNNRIKENKTYQNIATLLLMLTLLYIAYVYINHYSQKKKIKELEAQVRKNSITDKITNLYSRDYFDEIINRKLNSVKRGTQSLAFVVINLNNFNNYTKIHGYQKSNIVLQLIAKILQNTLNRSEDYLFRLGDKEFGLLLSNMEYQKTLEIIQKLQENIINAEIDYGQTPDNITKLTTSISIVYLDSGEEFEELAIFSGAYKALATTKNNLKNTICIYDPKNNETKLVERTSE